MSHADTAHTSCWTPAWVQQVTRGRWLIPPSDPDSDIAGLGIDTRTLTSDQAFLAVKGENFDGHAFVNTAFNNGAAIAIIDQPDAIETSRPTNPVLLVNDTVQSLQTLARDYRQRLREAGCTVIAVVGSNGKTTTRNLIHAVLSSTFAGTQSPKSFNNHLGVPITILGAALTDRFLIAEVGTNHPGEIDRLGDVLKPDAAVVTSIGHEHMEFFGDLKGVAEEEAAITQHLPDRGTLFIEHDALDWITKASAYKPADQVTTFGQGAHANHGHRQLIEDRQRFSIRSDISIDLPLLAPHDVSNALAAVAVGRWMGIEDAAIKTSLEQAQPMPGRLVVNHFTDVTVIDDTYNANPDSVRAALDLLAEFPADDDVRRVAVLGDMLELGDLAADAHREVGLALRSMAESGSLHRVVLVGPLMAEALQAATDSDSSRLVDHHADFDEYVLDEIAKTISPGSLVLCKGSRGLELERLIPRIEQYSRSRS